MKKVISFSLWGTNPKYCCGAIRNAELAKELFPDWECWFYVRMNGDICCSTLRRLAGMDNTHMIPVNKPCDWTGMFDRFEAALFHDDDVEVMISRDCDSRLSSREKAAVDEWLESGKGFHIMRDHPWHGSKMLGGMWGMRSGALPEFLGLLNNWKHEDRWQTDQEFLNQEIYPRIVNDAMVHASFFKLERHAKDFPTERKDYEFIGQVFDENEVTVQEHLDALKKELQ